MSSGKNVASRFAGRAVAVLFCLSLPGLPALGLWQKEKAPDLSAQTPENLFGHRAKPGEVTSQGHLILYHLSGGFGAAVVLETAYGFLIVNEGTVKHPKSLFLMASAKEKRVKTYTSLSTFKQALLRLPKGAKLYRYDRCTDTASRGLPSSLRQQIRHVCRQGGIPLMNMDEPILTCICGP